MGVQFSSDLVRTNPSSFSATWNNATNSSDTTFSYRDGKFLHIHAYLTWSGAGDGAPLSVDLDGAEGVNPVIDTAALASGTTSGAMLDGLCMWIDATVWREVYPTYVDTNTVGFSWINGTLNGSGFASGDTFSVHFKVPIVGW